MAKEASLCLLLLPFLIFSCSGALVGFSYHERGDTLSSSGTISFLQQSNVPSSQIQVFVTDHRILSTLTNSNVLVDVYLNKSQVENLIASEAQLLNLLPSSDHIKSIIISSGSEWLSQNEVPLLLNALKSIHSVLSKLKLGREVKLSVAFPLSFLEKLSPSQENDILSIISFIKETKSFVTIEESIDGESSKGDHFVRSIIKRASLATSVLPCKDVPMVLKFKSSILSNSIEVAQFGKRVSKYLEARTHITKGIAALYVEVNTIEDFSSNRRILDDTTNPTNTIFPTNPASKTPIITPSDTPTIIQVPSTNPAVTISPTNPAAIPVTVPPGTATPVPSTPTNPANSPLTPTNPANPATTTPTPVPVTSNPPPSGTVPVINAQPPPSTSTNAPPSIQGGQSWCVAKTGAPEAALQSALDYACGMGGADCSQIQQGGSCYSPITLQNHASYAFNSYYQKNPAPTSCDFGGTATLVNTNPSTGSCIFPSSASSSSSSSTPTSSSPPTTPTQSNSTPPPSPVTPPLSNPTPPAPSIPFATPTPPSSSGNAISGYGTPPSVLNSSNPAAASGTMPDFGSESPPVVNTTSASNSVAMRPLVCFIVLVISFVAETLSMRL